MDDNIVDWGDILDDLDDILGELSDAPVHDAPPKNAILPQIPLYYDKHYRTNPNSKAKKPRKMHWYTDYVICAQFLDVPGIVALMDTRSRFAGLREFVGRVCNTRDTGYRTRFVIDAQTLQDCYLAVLYLNYHFAAVGYHNGKRYINYDCTYQYHTHWRTRFNNDNDNSPTGVLLKSAEADDTGTGTSADPEDGPVWRRGCYPVYISAGDPNCAAIVGDADLLCGYDLIYVLDNRDKANDNAMIIDMMFGLPTAPAKNADDALTLAGFKRIYIPDADTDDLRDLFVAVADSMHMRVGKDLQFATLRQEYAKFLGTEPDIQAVAKLLYEYKICAGQRDKPISYKDFIAVLDASAARKAHAASKKPDKNAKTPWQELDDLVGNEHIKTDIRRMVDALLLDKRRRELGLPGTAITMHSLFFGAPGTSKTTVSRLIAAILKHEGIIKGDAFRECVKSDVVGQYVGWTAAAVDKLFSGISDAGGGVLFFDEAYTYTQDPTVFDREAVNCIVQNMENHRQVMCIFAGYKEPMQNFVEANPGLRSRIGFVFEFGDYDSDAMYAIAQYQARALGFKLPDGSEKMLTDYFTKLKRLQGDGWGNGREARKILEQASLQLAGRLAKMKRKPTKADCTQLTIDDVTNAIKNSLEKEGAFEKEQRRIGFCS